MRHPVAGRFWYGKLLLRTAEAVNLKQEECMIDLKKKICISVICFAVTMCLSGCSSSHGTSGSTGNSGSFLSPIQSVQQPNDASESSMQGSSSAVSESSDSGESAIAITAFKRRVGRVFHVRNHSREPCGSVQQAWLERRGQGRGKIKYGRTSVKQLSSPRTDQGLGAVGERHHS